MTDVTSKTPGPRNRSPLKRLRNQWLGLWWALAGRLSRGPTRMVDEKVITRPKTAPKPKVDRPKLHKVILVNDDFTPREFVVTVLKGEFRLSEDQAYRVMITAHRRGVCVVAVFPKDVAETKATRATDAGKAKGYPLMFTTEPEE